MGSQDSWVIVDACESTKNVSDARHPQYNTANESSQQLAGTTTGQLDRLARAFKNKLQLGEGGYDPNYPVNHKPPSFASQGTASTDTTAHGSVSAANVAFTSPYAGLTEYILAKHQQELEALCPGDMGAWLEGAGPQCTRLAVVTHHKMGRGGCHAARSKPSQASDGSYVDVPLPTTEAGRGLDIRAAGTLFNEQAFGPFVYDTHIDM